MDIKVSPSQTFVIFIKLVIQMGTGAKEYRYGTLTGLD